MWFVKQGAMYETRDGSWTWSRARGREYHSKGGALPPGQFWSREYGNNIGRETEAFKRELVRAAMLP